MATRMWKGLLILAGAALLVVTTGTAVVAMINDDDEGMGVFTDERPSDQQGGAVAAVCAPGFPDCQDTIVEGADGEFEQCATAEPCGDFDAKCAANTACMEPGMLEALYCDPGATIEACYPDGTPAGYDCVTQESFPIQVVCFPADCLRYDDGGITILPAPGPNDDGPVTILPDPTRGDQPIGAPQPGIAGGEISSDGAATIPCASPPVNCDDTDPSVVRCLPPDCAITSDGAINCPVAPPAGGGSGSSDGSPGAIDGSPPSTEPSPPSAKPEPR